MLRETKAQHAGRFIYVKTKFPLVAGDATGVLGHANCPKGSQLTGAFASGFAGTVNGSTVLPAELARENGNDRGKVADNGVVASIVNRTGSAGQATVEAICERPKKKRPR